MRGRVVRRKAAQMLSPCEEISGDYYKNAAPEVGSPTLSRGMVGPPQPPQIAKIKASGFLRQMRDATTAWSGYYTAVMTTWDRRSPFDSTRTCWQTPFFRNDRPDRPTRTFVPECWTSWRRRSDSSGPDFDRRADIDSSVDFFDRAVADRDAAMRPVLIEALRIEDPPIPSR